MKKLLLNALELTEGNVLSVSEKKNITGGMEVNPPCCYDCEIRCTGNFICTDDSAPCDN